MTGHRWKRAVAILLAGGMLLSQGGYVYAAEPGSAEGIPAAAETPMYALDASGASLQVSDTVNAMINDGTVYLDEASGYLLRAADGRRVDPVSGEAFPEEEASPPVLEEEGETAEMEEESGSSDIPETGTEPGEGTDGAADSSQSTEEPLPEDTQTEEPQPEVEDTQTEGTQSEAEDTQTEGTQSEAEDTQTEESQSEAEDTQAEETQPEAEDTQDAQSGGKDSISDRDSLIRGAQIVQVPVIVDDFRFWTVARKYGFAKEDIYIRETIPEDTPALTTTSLDESSVSALQDLSQLSLAQGLTEGKIRADLQQITESVRAVGYLKQDGLVYILKEEENGWLYVESGTVRGFIKADEIHTGEEAQKILETYQQEAKQKAEKMGQEYSGIEIAAPIAEALVSPADNEAYTWLRATVGQTVIVKEYAIASVSGLNIREGKGEDTDVVGTMEKGALCYIIADKADEWIYVESGDVRGFVKGTYLEYGEGTTEKVEAVGEENFPQAEQTVEPGENDALYYTLTSVKSGVPGGEVRQSLLTFASQFIGNPYVWGGTSLTDGADCSGFVQSIYREYGYELPRVAADQAYAGTQIPVEDALPGDLVFYADDSGDIYHVVIYAGDGKTIEAQSSKTGIVQGTLDTADAVWAVRLLEDNALSYGVGDISEVNASTDMYGENLGVFDLTYYCACEICCDVETGITATGTPVVEGRTIAVDPSVIPYGTQVIINGHVFTAEDCGGAVRGNHIDIYVNDHQTALELGRNQAEVYLVK